jgi:hypothetical protein
LKKCDHVRNTVKPVSSVPRTEETSRADPGPPDLQLILEQVEEEECDEGGLAVRLRVSMAASMKVPAFWSMAPCSLVLSRPTFQRCVLSPSSGR